MKTQATPEIAMTRFINHPVDFIYSADLRVVVDTRKCELDDLRRLLSPTYEALGLTRDDVYGPRPDSDVPALP